MAKQKTSVGDGFQTGLKSGLRIVAFVNSLLKGLSKIPGGTVRRGGTLLPMTDKQFQRVIRAEFPGKPQNELAKKATKQLGYDCVTQSLQQYCSYFNGGLHKMGITPGTSFAKTNQSLHQGEVDRLSISDIIQIAINSFSGRTSKTKVNEIVERSSHVNRSPFQRGKTYVRREIHKDYGGQQQGGISTPKSHPMVFLITGDSGEQYGYADGFREDGMFWYTGEGQVGDMTMTKGNLAIQHHEASGESLHLFSDKGGGKLQYQGEAKYLGHHQEVAPDRNGSPRKAIVFELAMLSTMADTVESRVTVAKKLQHPKYWKQSLTQLRELALAETPSEASVKTAKTIVRKRSEAVKTYVLRRGDGACEGCLLPAPFETMDGKPYLEPHHTTRLADGGPDHPRWVISLCPNCHARVHYSADGDDYNFQLVQKLGELEPDE